MCASYPGFGINSTLVFAFSSTAKEPSAFAVPAASPRWPSAFTWNAFIPARAGHVTVTDAATGEGLARMNEPFPSLST